MNHLEFLIMTETVAANEDTEAHQLLSVVPIIDGLPFDVGVLDAALLFALGARTYEFDLFTCSCGDGGCAGFFDSVKVVSTETEVRWHIPEAPYRARMAAELLPPPGSPIVFTFEKQAYLAALQAGERALLAHEAASDLPSALAPVSYPDLTTTVAAQLAETKAWLNNRLAEIAEEKQFWGPLYDATIEVTIPESTTYGIWLTMVARQMALNAEDEEVESAKLRALAATFNADTEAAFQAVRTLGPNTLMSLGWRIGEHKGNAEANTRNWAAASFRLALATPLA